MIRTNFTLKLLFFLVVIVSGFLTLFINPLNVLADTACGDGSTCTGSTAYLKVGDCMVGGPTWCANANLQPSFPHSCPTGGGPGSCTAFAAGKNGCNMYVPVPGGSCTCFGGGAGATCSVDGVSCGNTAPYSGTCSCTGGSSCDSYTPQGGNLGCCYTPAGTTPTPTPSNPPQSPPASGSPPPSGYCNDTICNGAETCTSCETDCGVCGGQCGWCGNGICDQGGTSCGNETSCSCAQDCGYGCTSQNNCSVSLTPPSVGLTVGGTGTTLTATVNATGGSVSRVNFTNNNGNVVSIVAPSDSSVPYQTSISPISAGTATITATCEMNLTPGTYIAGGDTTTVTVLPQAPPPPGQPLPQIPVCEGFSIPQSTYDVSAGTIPITVDSFYEGADYGYLAGDGNNSFEFANTSGWLQSNLDEFWTPDSLVYGPPAHGRYYLKIKRDQPGDSYAVSEWIDVGENVNGRSFTLKFLAKAHDASAATVNMQLQRYPNGGDWTSPPQTLYSTPITLSASVWQEYENTFTFSNHPGYNESRVRVVLRPPSDGSTWPVYYDNVRLHKNWTTDVDYVRFFYTTQQGNYCAPIPAWANANNGSGSNQLNAADGTHNWNISGLTAGTYMIAANITGEDAAWCSGNPDAAMCAPNNNCSTCSIPVTITSCPTGTPGAPTSPAPSGNYDMTSTNNQVTLTWEPPLTGATYVDEYDIVVWDTGDFASANAAWAVRTTSSNVMFYDTVSAATLARTITNMQNEYTTGRNLSFAVRARNTSCGNQNGIWSAISNFSLIANLTGSIYLGDGSYGISGGICINGGISPVPAPGATAVVSGTVSGGYAPITTNVTFDGGTTAYTITGAAYTPNTNWGTVTVSTTFNSTDPTNTVACACPAPGADPFVCQYTGLTNPQNAITFYAEQYDLSNGPWWQGVGGLIYATTNGILSNITDQCVADSTGVCTPYISIRDAASTNKTAGLAIAAAGTISSGTSNAGYYREADQLVIPPATNYHVEGADFSRATRQDYAYFARNFDLAGMNKINVSPIRTKGQLTVGYTDPNDGTQVSYREGSLTINPNPASTLNFTSGERRIVFVRDDLIISDTNNVGDVINVDQGGYVAFIVGGNITISDSVGFTDATTPVSDDTSLEGVYIADGSITVAAYANLATQNRKFIGAGTFVGWGGIALNRTFENTSDPLSAALNNLDPISVFVYRPDFVETTPEALMTPGILWQEVN